MNSSRFSIGRHLLRVACAGTMVIHGITRLRLGTVDDFGGFLSGVGLPGGVAVAWLLTLVEIGGGATLISGRLVYALCAWFAVQLAVGIVLVHASEGWFVVGAGRGGMEYSVILIVCFIVTILLHESTRPLAGGGAPIV